tara:strand:+ start:13869 stop:14381 length:513 start_codon:yes stop_codon:yes gene_type:complete
MQDVWLETWLQCKPYVKNFDTAIDVGYRRGEFARNLTPLFSKVIGFEFRYPKYTNQGNLEVYNYALGDENTISYTSNNAGRIKGNGPREVIIKKLDSFDYNNIGFIKLDVEGFEPKVLLGAKATIEKCNPVICCEINRSDNNSQQILENWGYKLMEIDKLQGHDYIFTRS